MDNISRTADFFLFPTNFTIYHPGYPGSAQTIVSPILYQNKKQSFHHQSPSLALQTYFWRRSHWNMDGSLSDILHSSPQAIKRNMHLLSFGIKTKSSTIRESTFQIPSEQNPKCTFKKYFSEFFSP